MVDGHVTVTTEPRWFTDNSWAERRAVCFMDSDGRHWTVEESDWPWTSEEASADATNALVAAVREADILNKARKIAVKIRPFGNFPGRVDHVALDVLLTLLSSAAPDTVREA